MKLIFFAPLVDEGDRQINNLIDKFTAVSDLEIYRTIESLSDRLCQPQQDATVAVVIAVSRETLVDIITIKEFFSNIRLILVLPDRESDTVAKGHMLRPRFMTYADTDLGEVPAVIEKMLETVSFERAGGNGP